MKPTDRRTGWSLIAHRMGCTSMVGRKVRIVGIKEFASGRLPEGSTLRYLLLTEREEIDTREFVARMDLWLKLLQKEYS